MDAYISAAPTIIALFRFVLDRRTTLLNKKAVSIVHVTLYPRAVYIRHVKKRYIYAARAGLDMAAAGAVLSRGWGHASVRRRAKYGISYNEPIYSSLCTVSSDIHG